MCCLKNGAIIASDTDYPNYPKNAKSYRYVWPRDAAYACVALGHLDLAEYANNFFSWCLDRAFGLSEDGLFLENYHTNGVPNNQSGFRQLDQSGQMIWAISELKRLGYKSEDGLKLAQILGDGLCGMWNGKNFRCECTDLWEERVAHPKLNQIHTYSLAACANGLFKAYELAGDERYLLCANSMKDVLDEVKDCFLANVNGEFRNRIDASLLGLAWPHNIFGKDKRIIKAVRLTEKELNVADGFVRYQHDVYDGWQLGQDTVKAGAGTWPLITLWMALARYNLGEKDVSKKLLDSFEKKFQDLIPEQVFTNNMQTSVTPLCWAHSLYIICKKTF